MTLSSRFRRAASPRPPQARPALEGLEGRQLLSASTISGYVFKDAGNDGLYGGSDAPIAGSTLVLYRANNLNRPVASAVTDANGYYQFSTDNTVSQVPGVLTRLVSFSPAKTGWTRTAPVAQFDPALGTLLAVEVVNTATLKTEFQVENVDDDGGNVSATVNGNVTLTLPGALTLAAQLTSSDTFDAAAYDGAIDFAGPSGHDSGLRSRSASNSTTLTAANQLQAFVGTGTVTLSARASTRSTVSAQGNVATLINATAGADVEVRYHYVPSNALQPGPYVIVQPNVPAGYLPGLKSSGGVVIPNSVNTNRINVTLQSTDSTNNNFAEIQPSSLSGHVYLDLNNDGQRQASEAGIRGVQLTLTGRNDLGAIAAISVLTDASGAYNFGNLRPGTYTITRAAPPSGYVAGKANHPGTVNGLATGTAGGSNQFSGISVSAPNSAGADYDFALVPRPATPQTPVTPTTPPAFGKAFLTGYWAYLHSQGIV